VNVKCRWGAGARTVSASRAPKSCAFFWWQEGQNHRPLQENASKYSWAQWSQRTRAKPLAKSPQLMNFSTTAGDINLLPKVLAAGNRFQQRPDDATMQALVDRHAMETLFV